MLLHENWHVDNRQQQKPEEPSIMNAPTTASAHTHMGTPPPDYHEEWATHTVHVHGFARLSSAQGAFMESPEFMLLGNQWCLRIYPGGIADADEGKTSLFLFKRSDKAIEVEYDFRVNDGNGKQVAYTFAKRSTLLSAMVNGALAIEIHMRLAEPTKSVPAPFIPQNPSACKIIQGLFLNNKSANIMFEVGGGEKPKNNAMKAAKPAPVSFPAHRCIVENCSSILAELCESHDDSAAIQINDVTPDIFRLLLSYVYGANLSDDDMKSHAKEIIDAADKYGVIDLKLEAEACFVKGITFTIKNVMEHLLYAESKNCALLKEASMDYIVENKAEVITKLSFADTVPGTLMRDLLVATARGEMRSGGADVNADSQYDSLRISELRKKAHEKGLNVDGSREMLIAALKAV